MYQDTEVDLKSFMEVAKDAMAQRAAQLESAPITKKKAVNTTDAPTNSKTDIASKFSHQTHGAVIQDEPMSASTVRNVQCAVVPSRRVLHIDWEAPWNLRYINVDTVYYELRVQGMGGGVMQRYFSNGTEMEVPLPGLERSSVVDSSASLTEVTGLLILCPLYVLHS